MRLLIIPIILSSWFFAQPLQAEETTVEEWYDGLGRLQSKEARGAIFEFRRDVREISRKYTTAFLQRLSELQHDLGKTQEKETKANRLDSAVQIRDTMDSLDQISTAPALAQNSSLERFIGTWKGRWGTSGTGCTVVVGPDNSVRCDGGIFQMELRDDRWLGLGRRVHQNIELITSDDRLIVLGWTVQRGRDPLKNQHDHVAIVQRSEEE